MAFHVNLDKVREEAALVRARRCATTQRKTRWYAFTPGVQSLRILPPGPDEATCYIPGGILAMPVYTHWLGNKRLRCVELTYPKRKVECPIHAVLREYRQWNRRHQVSSEEEKRVASRLIASGRAYTNCIDRNDDKPEVVLIDGKQVSVPRVQVVGFPIKIYQSLVNAMVSDAAEDITDELNGNDVIITVQGSGLHTRYLANLKTRPTPLDEDPAVRRAILKRMHNIEQLFAFPDEHSMDAMAAEAEKLRSELMSHRAA